MIVKEHTEIPEPWQPNSESAVAEDMKIAEELSKLRSQVQIPYLKPLPKSLEDVKLYTLVLDLDETLIHFEAGK
jgi:hypothetical protein